MDYTTSLPFGGSNEAALRLAESALTGVGFQITRRTARSVEMAGPGMNNNRQSPLVGASQIHLECKPGELTLEANLGGVKRMTRFVTLFPIGLVLCLGVVLSVVFGFLFGPGTWITAVAGAGGANAAVWLLLGPLIARGIRGRTIKALDSLLANMVAVGTNA